MFLQRRAENATLPAPVSIETSGTFDGNDGKWSTFLISVGDDGTGLKGQDFKVHISTLSALIQVPMETHWCTKPDEETCAENRGVQAFKGQPSLGFQSQESPNYKQYGLFNLALPLKDLELTPDKNPNASYVIDTVGLGPTSEKPLMLADQLVAQTTTQDFFMGSLGLSSRAVNAGAGPRNSFLPNFNYSGTIPSESYGYTAGAHYRNGSFGALGSLIFGGYDHSRLRGEGTSITMPENNNQSLIVGVQDIQYNPDRAVDANEYSMMDGTSGFYAFIDSSLPYLWLPRAICDKFEDTFQLEWDSQRQLYTVDDEAHTNNVRQNATVTFKIMQNPSPNDDFTTITLPYAAFDLEATFPIFENTTKYFPLKRSPTGTYVLGRAFLQEAYIIVDYERNNFTVAPAQYSETMPSPRIVPIRSKNFVSPEQPSEISSPGKGGLSTGAIVGIAVGIGILVNLLLICAFFFWRRRRDQKQKAATGKPAEIDTMDAGSEFKHRRVSELDSTHAPSSPKPPSLPGYYDRDRKDTIPFPPINEMESPPAIVELESPPLDSTALSSTSPHSEIADYFGRRGTGRESSGHRTPGTPVVVPGHYELPGDDGRFQVGGQHFEPVASSVHSRGPSDATTQSNIDTMVSGPERRPSETAHARGPSDAPTMQSESTTISDPTSEQLKAWAFGHEEGPRRPLSP